MAKTNTQVSPPTPDWVTQKDFQAFKSEVNQNFKQIDKRFDMINNHLDRIDDKLDLIDEKFAIRDKQLQELEKNSNLQFKLQNESLVVRIERNNRQQWAWNITILIALITLVITTRLNAH
ncbi:unnamed protein product [Fructobacillus fructosus]|uniref:hypothetical protein n=1 Tax=Fructobacillus fructosus TaxID=1631 RepID=UPI002DB0965D|nr:unnamed protein product [Fructobacillus fructosus]